MISNFLCAHRALVSGLPIRQAIGKFNSAGALIYGALILSLMEYFFIPPRAMYFFAKPSLIPTLSEPLQAGIIWSLSCLIGFILIPMIIQKLILKNSLSEIGYSTKDFLKHAPTYLFLFALVIPVIFYVSSQESFSRTYPLIPEARESLKVFFIWEAFYVAQFFALEAFFRGYFLFSLNQKMEKWTAIAVMTVPYTMIHFHKPFVETMGAIVAGMVLGNLALKNKSWLGGAMTHSLVAVTMDCLASKNLFI